MPILRNLWNRRNLRKIIITFLHRKNSLRIISHCTLTTQKMKFSIKDFFSKCDQMYSHLLKKFLKENFIYCAMSDTFSGILSVKNHPNFIFRQFHVFGYAPIPKNQNVEFEESLESLIYCTSDE